MTMHEPWARRHGQGPAAPPVSACSLRGLGKRRTCGRGRCPYASWNGSTQTRAWQVLAGPGPDRMSVVAGHAPRTGFETAVTTPSPGPYFQVKTLDAQGKVIGVSRAVTRPSRP